jgi:hypothetical protein
MASEALVNSRIRKICLSKLGKLEERSQVENILIETKRIEKQVAELSSIKALCVGRLALLDEFFKSDSIFENPKLNKEPEISQWIQQAFRCEEVGVQFNDDTVSWAHAAYMDAIKQNSLIDSESHSTKESLQQLLTDIQLELTSITMDDLNYLFKAADKNPYSEYAMKVLVGMISKSRLPAAKLYHEVFCNEIKNSFAPPIQKNLR